MAFKKIILLILVGFEALAGYAQEERSSNQNTMQSLPTERMRTTGGKSNAGKDGRTNENAVAVKISRGRPITEKKDFLALKWSPDGRYILSTKGKYRGLYILSLKDRSVRTLTDAPGVGYDARWSKDGRLIIMYEHDRLKVIDMEGKPAATEHAPFTKDSIVVYARDDEIYLRSGQTRRETKVSRGEDKFFMPLLSPDRKKVAYIGLSSGVHIKDLESGGIVSIGLGTDIAWMPDSKGIIYTHAVDDGHRIVSSDLYFAYARGGDLINLTRTPNRQESHAAISPDGSGLAYIVDGRIFLSELNRD